MPRSSERSRASAPVSADLLDRRYRLETLIGRGGMGFVYRALDTRLEQSVAIKLLRDIEDADKARFEAEVRTLARFKHPNLIRVLDAGEVDGRPYLVMDLIEGSTVAQLLTTGAMSHDQTAKIGSDIAGALDYVHSAGIVHRDVKPANILVDRKGNGHLADFGIARLVDTTGLTATGMTLGTPAYLAPEQLQGTAITPSVDVYALGLVLLECLTGRRGFEGTASEITAARLSRDPMIPPSLGTTWQQILRSMTSRDPAERITASAAAAALQSPGNNASYPPTQPLPTASTGNTTKLLIAPLGDTGDVEVTQTATLTAVAPIGADNKHRRSRYSLSKKGGVVAALVITMVATTLGLALAGVFSPMSPTKNSPKKHPHSLVIAKSATSTTAATTTTTSTTTTTTTLIPSLQSAANGVLSTLENGVSDGNIITPAAQQIYGQLQPLLNSTSAQSPQNIQQFDQVVQSFDQDVSNGTITGTSTISALTSSIANLATSLGTTVPSTTTTTTVSPPGPSYGGGPGFGHGNGDGQNH